MCILIRQIFFPFLPLSSLSLWFSTTMSYENRNHDERARAPIMFCFFSNNNYVYVFFFSVYYYNNVYRPLMIRYMKGRASPTKTGPNDAGRDVWALCEYFSFSSYFWYQLMFQFFLLINDTYRRNKRQEGQRRRKQAKMKLDALFGLIVSMRILKNFLEIFWY